MQSGGLALRGAHATANALPFVVLPGTRHGERCAFGAVMYLHTFELGDPPGIYIANGVSTCFARPGCARIPDGGRYAQRRRVHVDGERRVGGLPQ